MLENSELKKKLYCADLFAKLQHQLRNIKWVWHQAVSWYITSLMIVSLDITGNELQTLTGMKETEPTGA